MKDYRSRGMYDMALGTENELNREALRLLYREIKLHINRKLYERGAITEEMYAKAGEWIMKGT